MPIQGLSERRRLPRAGIIRLGKKQKNSKGTEYPVETDYFIVPDAVKEVYGEKPKELLIMFPVEDENMFFQQWYKCYGKGILLCRGDGETGHYWDFDEGGTKTKPCPCEKLEQGKCKPIGILQFLLPEVEGAVGVYQISTGSKNSIIDINSGIDMVRKVAGRIALIPLRLKREPMETQRIEGKEIKKGRHYTMKIDLAKSLVQIQRLAQRPVNQALLPEPDDSYEAAEDLLLNGHGEAEIVDGEAISEDEQKAFDEVELKSLARDLDLEVEEFEREGGELTKGERKRVQGLANADEYRKAIAYFKGKKTKLMEGKDENQQNLI
jgi:hypothetical protein